ncbi:MAG: BON domain-containing protein [Actinomycetota bacterium]|nr:BON domain-containing protein [Actinomycetota bacterium]
MSPSDADLGRLIAETLAADERFRRQPVAVQVQNGVAILTGRVDGAEVYDALMAQVRELPGVRDVCDGLLIADGETLLREAHQFGAVAAGLATLPSPPRRGSPAAVTARVVMILVTAAIVLIEVAGWLAALFGVGLLAWAADILLRRHRRR